MVVLQDLGRLTVQLLVEEDIAFSRGSFLLKNTYEEL